MDDTGSIPHTYPESHAATTYTFLPAYMVPEELSRLDGIHSGITEYFGNKLSLAPLTDQPPASILELGSGSGAWAIHAASMFPHARVTAVDLSVLPERHLPQNLTFVKADIAQQLPFGPDSFDVIHARLLMMHLPNAEQVIVHVTGLLKPGGWLILEDPDDENMLDHGRALSATSAVRIFVHSWLQIVRSRGANPCIGKHLEQILQSTNAFSEVNVRKVRVPYSSDTADSTLNKLGHTWKENALTVTRDLASRFVGQGVTADMADRHLKELLDPSHSFTTDMYFTWSLKRTDT